MKCSPEPKKDLPRRYTRGTPAVRNMTAWVNVSANLNHRTVRLLVASSFLTDFCNSAISRSVAFFIDRESGVCLAMPWLRQAVAKSGG